MRKYIDRAALFNSLSGAKTVEEIFAAIQAAPAAYVQEIRRGHWMHISERTHACSICGKRIWIYKENYPFAKYCPYCGAAMIEEEEA